MSEERNTTSSVVDTRSGAKRRSRQTPYRERVTWDPRDRFTPLVLRAQAGQLDCLGEAWVGLTPYLTSKLLRNNLARQQDVDNILQDAYLNAQKNLASFNYKLGTAASWFWTITHHRAIDEHRRKARARTVGLDDEPVGGSTEAESDDEAELLLRLVEDELASAKPVVRQAFELRFFNRCRYADISRKLGVPVGTLATWFHRLRNQLRARAAADA